MPANENSMRHAQTVPRYHGRTVCVWRRKFKHACIIHKADAVEQGGRTSAYWRGSPPSPYVYDIHGTFFAPSELVPQTHSPLRFLLRGGMDPPSRVVITLRHRDRRFVVCHVSSRGTRLDVRRDEKHRVALQYIICIQYDIIMILEICGGGDMLYKSATFEISLEIDLHARLRAWTSTKVLGDVLEVPYAVQ